jgi:Thrombospondin type 3 repeat/RTX calcium-binding nonapeptide repeat (4 copies)
VRLRAVLLLSVLVLAVAPGAAAAHSLVRPGGAVVSYLSADATSLNELVVRPDGGRIEFRDLAVDGGMDPGTCTPGDLNAQSYIVQVFCPAAPVQRIRVDLGDREDTATINVAVPATVLAGTGSDRVTGGEAGDEIDGGTGSDTIDGGAGDDRIAAADGVVDDVRCGPGNDSVDADGADTVAADCETVVRDDVPVPPAQPGAEDVPGPPGLAVGAAVLQPASQGGAVRIYATATERATISASGFLDAAGLQLPIERLTAQEVAVGGGGAVLTYRLRGREWREADRSLRRGRRVRVRLAVVATDPSGASRRRDAPVVRLLRSRDTALATYARHPTPDDVDGDEVKNDVDNCVNVKNGSQIDTDKDGQGDACDEDDDGDGVGDGTDNCRVTVNPDQKDTDGDGRGDVCPAVNSDADPVLDEDDNCDTIANPDQQDIDGDDKGDVCDSDDDGDGFDDAYDNCPTVYNLEPTDTDGDGFINDQSDRDGDGIGTACDPDESTVAAPTPAPTPPTVALEASAATATRMRASVVGAGPIVTARCSAACTVRSVLEASGKTLASGSAELTGAGTTYVFTRFGKRIRKPVRAALVTTFADASGKQTVDRQTVRLRP